MAVARATELCKSTKDTALDAVCTQPACRLPEGANVSMLCRLHLALPTPPPTLPGLNQHVTLTIPLRCSGIPSKPLRTSGFSPLQLFLCLPYLQDALQGLGPSQAVEQTWSGILLVLQLLQNSRKKPKRGI